MLQGTSVLDKNKTMQHVTALKILMKITDSVFVNDFISFTEIVVKLY